MDSESTSCSASMKDVDSLDISECNMENSPVFEFYRGKTVFITGATGFMGKVLVEKLLRCTLVCKIYLLIRPKKGVRSQQRLEDLLAGKIFDRIREESPLVLKKVEVIDGDITEDKLGISEEQEDSLASSVNVIFHSAATVRFDEDLSKSLAMNVAGVMSVINLAKKMSLLEAMVDVSTAYCNCDLKHIEEKIYPVQGDAKAMVDICQWMNPEILDSPEVTRKMIGNRPNTYTYTKALAESVMASSCSSLPVSVMRPSIVSASLREPCPGWVDNFNGPSGIMAGAGTGVLRTLYCKRACTADMVPVDLCINLLCCVAWQTSLDPRGSLKVYNFTSGQLNPVTWGEVEEQLKTAIPKAAYEGALWYPGNIATETWYSNRFYQLLFHYCVAHTVDLLCWAVGKKPFLVKTSDFMQKSANVLEPFTTNSWSWTNDNTIALETILTEQDRAVFGFDIRAVDWKTYLDEYAQGIRDNVFQHNPATQGACRRKMWLLYFMHLMLQFVFLSSLLWILYCLMF